MPDELRSTPATDAVKALARFMHEPEVENEPRGQIQAELKQAGIDTTAINKSVREKIAQAKSRQRLAVASERRTSLLAKVSELKAMGVGKTSQLRAAVKDLLDTRFGGLQEARVLFHKFEEAKDEDLQSLLDDITLLDDDADGDPRG